MSNTPTKGNTPLYFGIALLLGVGAYFILNKDKNSDEPSEPASNDPTTDSTATANNDLILSKGSKGLEVGKLQLLLGITSDGVFGPNTEAKLLEVKGVKQISLNSFNSTPNFIKVKVIPIGTRVMANVPTANIYLAYRKADGTIYTKGEVKDTISYGADVGIIKSGINTNGLYVVYKEFYITDKDAPRYQIGMVKGTDIIKY